MEEGAIYLASRRGSAGVQGFLGDSWKWECPKKGGPRNRLQYNPFIGTAPMVPLILGNVHIYIYICKSKRDSRCPCWGSSRKILRKLKWEDVSGYVYTVYRKANVNCCAGAWCLGKPVCNVFKNVCIPYFPNPKPYSKPVRNIFMGVCMPQSGCCPRAAFIHHNTRSSWEPFLLHPLLRLGS